MVRLNFGLFSCRWRHRGPKPTKTLHREVVRPMQELESSQIGNPGLDQMNSEISRVLIRPLTRDDLPEARRIFCAAFGTFLGASELENFWADRAYVNGRFGAEHVASFAAGLDGELVGSNFAIRWGSLGFFGPNTMRPERQGRSGGQGFGGAGCQPFA